MGVGISSAAYRYVSERGGSVYVWREARRLGLINLRAELEPFEGPLEFRTWALDGVDVMSRHIGVWQFNDVL